MTQSRGRVVVYSGDDENGDYLYKFVGNALELRGAGGTFILLSETAFHALKPFQRIALERHARLIPVAVPVLEAIGGGSVRCMMAENFLASH